jgi:NAD-dependent dihydropyrimidine dehydrogenase PreA subunit
MATKAVRKIIKIDEEKCNGCGLCVPSCEEGALQIIEGKARIVKDIYCDGLGACLGECPEGALEIIEREAEQFDEEAVKAHLESSTFASAGGAAGSGAGERAAASGDAGPAEESPMVQAGMERGGCDTGSFQGCPGSRMVQFEREEESETFSVPVERKSTLGQWPVQLMLVPVNAPYFQDADLLVAADCVPFAHAAFHEDLLRGKALVVGCPKLDDIDHYTQKLTEILRSSGVKSVTVATMEVPCCSGLVSAVRRAVEASGKSVPMNSVIVGVRGELQT